MAVAPEGGGHLQLLRGLPGGLPPGKSGAFVTDQMDRVLAGRSGWPIVTRYLSPTDNSEAPGVNRNSQVPGGSKLTPVLVVVDRRSPAAARIPFAAVAHTGRSG
jgi:hypothetical protein